MFCHNLSKQRGSAKKLCHTRSINSALTRPRSLDAAKASLNSSVGSSVNAPGVLSRAASWLRLAAANWLAPKTKV
jgi:hypothetical protein